MEEKKQERVDFRRLPPRVTPEEMVEVKPVVRRTYDPLVEEPIVYQVTQAG